MSQTQFKVLGYLKHFNFVITPLNVVCEFHKPSNVNNLIIIFPDTTISPASYDSKYKTVFEVEELVKENALKLIRKGEIGYQFNEEIFLGTPASIVWKCLKIKHQYTDENQIELLKDIINWNEGKLSLVERIFTNFTKINLTNFHNSFKVALFPKKFKNGTTGTQLVFQHKTNSGFKTSYKKKYSISGENMILESSLKMLENISLFLIKNKYSRFQKSILSTN
ncbi:MAG: hypothetical protein IPP04_06905 [Saprospiraceae bacterium]|nr:hypothetical protein [Saprospiraceae bacterium]